VSKAEVAFAAMHAKIEDEYTSKAALRAIARSLFVLVIVLSKKQDETPVSDPAQLALPLAPTQG
jgi:PleD family two-component response regulator